MGLSEKSRACLLPTKVNEIGNVKLTSFSRMYPMICKEEQEPSLWQIDPRLILETACDLAMYFKSLYSPLPGSYFKEIIIKKICAVMMYRDVHCSIMYIEQAVT